MFYEALDRVNQELTGMIGATVMDARASNVQKGQAVRIPITPTASNEDVTASSSVPVGSGETISTVDITIDKIRRGTPILWTGEDELGVSGSGTLTTRCHRHPYTRKAPAHWFRKEFPKTPFLPNFQNSEGSLQENECSVNSNHLQNNTNQSY